MVEIQFGVKIKLFRSDNGTEFINDFCHDFFISKGILHQKSIVRTPQQNGVAERKHRHLLNTTRAISFMQGFLNTFRVNVYSLPLTSSFLWNLYSGTTLLRNYLAVHPTVNTSGSLAVCVLQPI